MTYKVLVTCKQMQESLEELLAETPMPDFSFTTPELTKQGLTSNEMAELIQGHDAAIVGDDVVDEAVLSVPGLKFVCKWGAGVDGIDFEAAKIFGVRIANTPGHLGPDVADLAYGYLISLARHTYLIHEKVTEGYWPRILGKSLGGMNVVVYGLGNVGLEVAKRLKVSGCEVRAVDTRDDFAEICRSNGLEKHKDLEVACRNADALVICCPLNDETRGSVNSKVLGEMTGGGMVVNVARGAVVMEEDLISLLDNGKIGGAALDVFNREPLPKESGLRKSQRVIFGSHNASNADGAVIKTSSKALKLVREEMSHL